MTVRVLGKVSRKKVSVLLDFVQMRGGGYGPAQIFCPLFTNCIYWVNLGMGREGETPAQFFCHIGVKKKRYKLSKLGRGGGVKVIWTKSKRTATFFREAFFKQGHWKQNKPRLWTLSLFTTETCLLLQK